MQPEELEFMPKELDPLPRSTVEQYIQNDFQFVKELTTQVHDGKTWIADKEGNLLNAQRHMPESEFINDWLDGFSLGRVGLRSYMDFDSWLKQTNQGAEAVVVHDDTDATKVLFIIPPLAIPQFTKDEQSAVTVAGRYMVEAKHAHERKDSLRANQIFLEATTLISQNVSSESRHLSDFIPAEYFAKFGILPVVRQNLIYCRDYFGLNPEIKEDWAMAESIFTKLFYHQALDDFERKFMELLSEGKWTHPEFSGEVPSVKIAVSGDNSNIAPTAFKTPALPTDSDPFEC